MVFLCSHGFIIIHPTKLKGNFLSTHFGYRVCGFSNLLQTTGNSTI
jgi:hypothetical protein